MTLPVSPNSISLNQVNVELGRSGTTTISLNETAVRTLAGVASGAISLASLYGKSNITFTPAGGTSAGSPIGLYDAGVAAASVSINCSQNAVWTYSGGGGGSSVSISSGSTASIISFYLSTDFNPRTANWTVSATSGGVTRYWVVDLEVYGYA